jgi:DNA-binding transcriptional ArsR family regulator
MGLTKSYHFSDQQNDIANFAKILSNPARIAIIEFLLENKSCICGDIVDVLPLAQATVSQHLKELKNMGIIKGVIEGKNICYCIDKDVWKKYEKMFVDFFEKINNCADNCC